MIHAVLPDGAPRRRLPFYLAMEEWVARVLPKGEYFFVWNVEPTVICGRHQDIPIEVDLAYCREHGIDVVRRKSGGGCVYADLDNLMLSYVSADTDVRRAFGKYTSMVAGALQALGVPAQASGRNDVLIDGRKVSGGAFWRLTDRSVAHSTMLVSTDFDNMMRAITPDRSKLQAHRVASVKSRITTLREHLPSLTVDALASHLVSSITGSAVNLTPAQVAEIEAMEQEYYRPEWLRLGEEPPAGATALPGKATPYSRGRRIEGVGLLSPTAALRDGNIESIALEGDFFSCGDIEPFLARCAGLPPQAEPLAEALEGIEAAIPGLSPRLLAEIIVQETETE